MNFIREYLIKKFLVQFLIENLEKFLAKLPGNDAKTVTGLVVTLLGILLTVLPQTAPYVQPILDYLRTLPANEIVAGGILWGAVGVFHKALKWIVTKANLGSDV